MKRRELPVGATVGDAYRLTRRLGEGARGTVYEARDLRRGTAAGPEVCAIKLMDGVIGESAEALATFTSQAEIASRPLHPQLLPVLDFGTDSGGQPFVVSQRLDGEDLAARMRRLSGGRFEPALVGHLIGQAARALAVAHRQGLYHLGLKPTNLFLVPQGDDDPDLVYVLDFGLSQVDNALNLEHPRKLEDSLPYVAPEQSGGRADPLDDRCDQWSLACIAWQMLTGKPPFAGADPTALLYQIVFEDPEADPPIPPAVPPPDTVIAVLDRALSKRPEDRFPDVGELARALEDAAGPLTIRPRKRRKGARPLTDASAGRSGPVFLPGVTPRRPAPGPNRRGAGATRLQGLRVRTAAPVGGPAPAVHTAAGPSVPPPEAATPVVAVSPGLLASPTPPPIPAWRRLLERVAGGRFDRVDRRRFLLLGAIPASAAILGTAVWGALRHRTPPVTVERASRPTIVPLEASAAPPTGTALKRTRKRARRARGRKRKGS